MAATTLIGAGTFAYFSDVAQSSNNSFGSGSMLLQLDNDGSSFFDDVSATFTVTSMAPGDSAAQEVSLHNAGSVSIAEIAMGLTSTNVDPGTDGSDLRNVLNMRVVASGTDSGVTCTGGTDITGSIDNAIGNGAAPLTMAEFSGSTYDSLPIPLAVSGGNDKVCVEVTMDPTTSDLYQNDSANATFVFTAHQNTSQ